MRRTKQARRPGTTQVSSPHDHQNFTCGGFSAEPSHKAAPVLGRCCCRQMGMGRRPPVVALSGAPLAFPESFRDLLFPSTKVWTMPPSHGREAVMLTRRSFAGLIS